MNRSLIALILLSISSLCESQNQNILLIISEDNGPEIGCYGTTIATPNLDQLASEGTLFENAYVPQAGCSQSRAALLTGLYPHQNGQIGLATWNYEMISSDIPNVVNTLKENGYRTGIIGKLHIKPKAAFKFDYKAIAKSNFQRTDMNLYAEKASEFFNSTDKPFYLQVNYPDAHRPFIKQINGIPKKPLKVSDVTPLPFVGINHPEIRQQTADYYNSIMRLDHYVGDLLEALEKSGASENTIVIYIGDHGADLPRGKRTCYEGGVRIPMIIRWPQAKENQRRSELVSTLDLFPTICDIAKIKAPKSLVGQSLKEIIHGKNQAWRKVMITEYHVHSNHNPWPQRAIRNERYKLIFNPLAGEVNPGYDFTISKKFFGVSESNLLDASTEEVRLAYKNYRKPPLFELYDLKEDPYEFKNLAKDPKYSKELKQLNDLLLQWQKESEDPFFFSKPSRKLFNLIRESGTKDRKRINYKSMMNIRH